jgi:hypothetical protein
MRQRLKPKPKATDRPLRVTMLSLAADTGYPGPATRTVTVWQGYKRFGPIARLVRLPLPARLLGPNTGMTICVPVMLTIRLSDRRNRVYRACQRPPPLRAVLAALCPLLTGPPIFLSALPMRTDRRPPAVTV